MRCRITPVALSAYQEGTNSRRRNSGEIKAFIVGVGTELFRWAELCDVITVAATSTRRSRTMSSRIPSRHPTRPNLSCMTKNPSPIFTVDPLMVSLFWPFDLWRSEKPFVETKSEEKSAASKDRLSSIGFLLLRIFWKKNQLFVYVLQILLILRPRRDPDAPTRWYATQNRCTTCPTQQLRARLAEHRASAEAGQIPQAVS